MALRIFITLLLLGSSALAQFWTPAVVSEWHPRPVVGCADFPTNGARHYYTFDEGGDTNRADNIGSADWLPIDLGGDNPFTTGIRSNAFYTRPGDLDGKEFAENGWGYGSYNPMATAFWFYCEKDEVFDWIVPGENTLSNPTFSFNSDGTFKVNVGSEGTLFSVPMTIVTWHFVVLNLLNNDWYFSIDGGTLTHGEVSYVADGTGEVIKVQAGTAAIRLDEWTVWDRQLTQPEIVCMWNSGAGQFPTILTAPPSFSIITANANGVTNSWSNVTGNQGYLIEESDNGGAWVMCDPLFIGYTNPTPANVTSFFRPVDSGLGDNTQAHLSYLRFRVATLSGIFKSPYSAVVQVPLSVLISDLTATASDDVGSAVSILVGFTTTSENYSGIEVYAKIGAAAYSLIGTFSEGDFAYTDEDATRLAAFNLGTAVKYKLRYVNSGGNGPYSNEATATYP